MSSWHCYCVPGMLIVRQVDQSMPCMLAVQHTMPGRHVNCEACHQPSYDRSPGSLQKHCAATQVDEYGQPLVLGPPALATTAVNIRAANPDNTANSSSSCCSLYTTMPAMARSMAIWKRISPGMLPGTSATPKSTTGEAHTYDPSLLEPVDFTHHLRKTDFAEYTEATLRGMQHIKAAAKK